MKCSTLDGTKEALVVSFAATRVRWGLIYLTHILLFVTIFLAVTGFCVRFLLPSVRHYVTSEVGPRSVFRPSAALTTNHLPLKGESWLLPRVNLPASDNQAYSGFHRSEEKSWNGIEADAETITILFRDKTALSFDFDPTLIIYPELADLRTGNWRGIKRWRSIHSKPSMVEWP